MHSLLKSVPDAEPFQDDCLAEFATRDDDRDHLLDGLSSRSWVILATASRRLLSLSASRLITL